jgi:hypothetical protein
MESSRDAVVPRLRDDGWLAKEITRHVARSGVEALAVASA